MQRGDPGNNQTPGTMNPAMAINTRVGIDKGNNFGVIDEKPNPPDLAGEVEQFTLGIVAARPQQGGNLFEVKIVVEMFGQPTGADK